MAGGTETSQGESRATGVGAELAFYAGVGAAQLEEAVRAIDESLFLVFADVDLSDGKPPTFAPQAMADLSALLERAALNVNAAAARLALVGPDAVKRAG